MNKAIALLGSLMLLVVASCTQAAEPPRWLGFNTWAPSTETLHRFSEAGVNIWVDMVTGAIYELPEDRVVSEDGKTILKDIPVYDAPALITDRSVVIY